MIKLYTHPNMPSVWIAIDANDAAWLVPARYNVWHSKRAFFGERARLAAAPAHCGFLLGLPK